MLDTEILEIFDSEKDSKNIERAGELLREGKTVIIPTETVYGLGANALDGEAVKQIYAAKGRPSDNPLIVHISELSELAPLVREIPEALYRTAERFWPGPITIIMPKSDIIPNTTSGGLDTVAVRMPENIFARKIIKAAGVPIAAPSANLSGKPSPTSFEHCADDMMGRVDAIVKSEPCRVGVESTVITLCTNPPRILRPGGITFEQLREVIPDIEIDKGVLNEVDKDAVVSSPGMKYKHYSPKCDVVLIKGDVLKYSEYINKNIGENECAVCFAEDAEHITTGEKISYGGKDDHDVQAREIFYVLRELDDKGYKRAYVHSPDTDGVGLAVFNRLIRSAGFNIIDLGDEQ